MRWGLMSLLGAAVGATLLLVLPASAFETIVPLFIAGALVLVVLQPRINRWVVARRHPHASAQGGPGTALAVFGTGIYGGYFGAAQGVILMGVLGIGIADGLQRLNGLKNVLAGLVNGIAGLLFILVADVDWTVVLLIAVGSVIGGQLGATVGRRLSPSLLRVVIVVVGLVALTAFLVS